jgi:hypothetical protein
LLILRFQVKVSCYWQQCFIASVKGTGEQFIGIIFYTSEQFTGSVFDTGEKNFDIVVDTGITFWAF